MMKHRLNLEDKDGDNLVKKFTKIPEEVTNLDCSLSWLNKKKSDDLILGFSNLSNNIKHINLSSNMICCINIDELAKIFSSIPEHITSINLSKNGMDTFELEDLRILDNTLSSLKTIYLSSDEIAKISVKQDSNQRYKSIGAIFPNVKDVIFVGNDGRERINDKNDHAVRRYNNAKKLHLKNESPSLREQASFLIWKKRPPTENSPVKLKYSGDELGVERWNRKQCP